MAEKLPRRSHCCMSPTARRFEKRRQARQDRAAARREPDAAPTKRAYDGWAD
jgi:hypothetical protein